MKQMMLAAALACGFAYPAVAQPPTAHPPATGTFADQAAVINRFEIQAGQLAQQKSDDDKIDTYARMIQQDHQKALNQLQSVLEGLDGVTVPDSLDQAHLSRLHLLKMSSGKQFKRTFKLQQIEGHKQAILLTQSYAESGENAQLKQWARETLPTLKKHLAHAQELPPNPGQPPVGSVGASPDRSQAKLEPGDGKKQQP